MSRLEKTLVGFTVFNAIWSFYTGFNLAYNGIMGTIFWGRLGILLIVAYLLVVLQCSNAKIKCFTHRYDTQAVLLTLCFLGIYVITWLSSGFHENHFLFDIVHVVVFIMMRDDLKIKCFEWFIKVLAMFLLLSVVEYLIYVITGFGIITALSVERTGDTGAQVFRQLIFNLILESRMYVFRFQSLCEEPGVVGTTCGLLLFLLRDNKQFKKEYFIFVIAGLLSFSLAFYAMFVIHLIASGTFKMRNMVIYILGVFIIYMFFQSFIDSFLFERIIGREFADIDNRSGADFAMQYEHAYKRGDLWLSSYNKGYDINGAGLKIFIWRYGIISLLLLIFSYSAVYIHQVRNLKSVLIKAAIFFVVFWASFYQRHAITNMEYMLIFFSAPLIFSKYSALNSNGLSTGRF